MAPEQVAKRMGPPLRRVALADFLGASPFTILTMPEPRQSRWFSKHDKPRPPSFYWYYSGWPELGRDVLIEFTDGVATKVRRASTGGPLVDLALVKRPRHRWAEKPIERHLARAARDHPDPRLTARRGWRRLPTLQVMQGFVLNVDAFPSLGETLPVRARRFADVDVFVTMLPVAGTDQIRALLPDGYLPFLDATLRDFGVGTRRCDIAHWILGHDEDGGGTVVHLAYVPSTPEITGLLPWDLLSAEEQNHGTKSR